MFHLGESSKIECWLLTFSFSFWSTWGKTSSNEVSSKIPLGACEWPKRRHEGFITWVFKGPKSFSSPGTKVAEVPVSKRPAVVWWFCPWLLLAPRWHQVCSLMPPQSEWQRKCFDSNSPQSFSLESLQCMRSVFIASDGCSPFEMTNIYIYILYTQHPSEIPPQPGTSQSWNWIFNAKPSTLGAPISITFWKPPASLQPMQSMQSMQSI